MVESSTETPLSSNAKLLKSYVPVSSFADTFSSSFTVAMAAVVVAMK
jgi:hypothetical protein